MKKKLLIKQSSFEMKYKRNVAIISLEVKDII